MALQAAWSFPGTQGEQRAMAAIRADAGEREAVTRIDDFFQRHQPLVGPPAVLPRHRQAKQARRRRQKRRRLSGESTEGYCGGAPAEAGVAAVAASEAAGGLAPRAVALGCVVEDAAIAGTGLTGARG